MIHGTFPLSTARARFRGNFLECGLYAICVAADGRRVMVGNDLVWRTGGSICISN